MTPSGETATEVLEVLGSGNRAALGEDLVGLYVYGSFLSGGFDPVASDLDLVAVLDREVVSGDLATLGKLHDDVLRRHPSWTNRLDIVYIGQDTLRTFRTGRGSFAVISPGEPFHLRTDVADWLQTWYLLRETSRPLVGPTAYELVPPVTRGEFVAALTGHAELMRARSHDERSAGALAYELLTVCRVLQTISNDTDPSKGEAAAWARQRWPDWAPVIDMALECRHAGGRTGFEDEASRVPARQFIEVVFDAIAAIRRTQLV